MGCEILYLFLKIKIMIFHIIKKEMKVMRFLLRCSLLLRFLLRIYATNVSGILEICIVRTMILCMYTADHLSMYDFDLYVHT